MRRLPQAFSSLETQWKNNMFPHEPFHENQTLVCDKKAVSKSVHQLKEECRLAQRLGCWVRDVRDLAALPLL